MREQFRSNTQRKGEPQSHKDSAQSVTDIIHETDDFQVLQRHPVLFLDGYGHEYDLLVFYVKKLNPDDDSDDSIQFYKALFVEIGDIGDDSRHNPGHKSQLINDGIAKAHVEKYYPKARYLKINKDDAFIKSEVLRLLRLDDVRTIFQQDDNSESHTTN
jgi:hypothetical protein